MLMAANLSVIFLTFYTFGLSFSFLESSLQILDLEIISPFFFNIHKKHIWHRIHKWFYIVMIIQTVRSISISKEFWCSFFIIRKINYNFGLLTLVGMAWACPSHRFVNSKCNLNILHIVAMLRGVEFAVKFQFIMAECRIIDNVKFV